MFDKINVSQIIADHIKTLRNDATKEVGVGDIVLFAVVPIFVFFLSLYFKLELKENIITLLISAFSIFAGLLINVLVLIYTVALRLQDDLKRSLRSELEVAFLKEIFANVSFGILMSILIVFVLAISAVSSNAINVFFTAACCFLITEFTFTFLMSLKRLHILLENRLKNES